MFPISFNCLVSSNARLVCYFVNLIWLDNILTTLLVFHLFLHVVAYLSGL